MSRITQREYEKRTKKEWKGVKVRSRVPLAHSEGKMPVGTLFTILDKAGGFTLETEPCSKCGVRFFIRKVQPHDLSLVDGAE